MNAEWGMVKGEGSEVVLPFHDRNSTLCVGKGWATRGPFLDVHAGLRLPCKV